MDKILDFRGEIGRKALHLLSLAMPASMLLMPRPWTYALLVTLSVIALATEIGRARVGAVHTFVDTHFGWMMRPEERIPGSGFCGATWVVVTATLLFAAFEPLPAAAGLSMALIGDAVAALVGRRWGRLPWKGSRRTVEGTMAFIASALLTSLAFPGLGWGARIGASVGAAVVEALPIPLNDNLILPFVAAGLITLLGL